MLDPAIQKFLEERKKARLKSKIKPSLSEEEVQRLTEDATNEFSLDNWLPKAANRACQISLVSHPSKFTHSSAKTSPIIALNKYKNDGFLRSGNVDDVQIDVSGNAAALDVYKFLSIKLSNGESILEQLEKNTESIMAQFSISTMSYDDIRAGLLVIKPKETGDKATSERVKQVYFPVNDDYHLLSILSPSGILVKIKNQIDNIRFSDEAKISRQLKKKNEFDEKGFEEIYSLTAIGYGGAKPQNLGFLNKEAKGVFYLLQSMPPVLKKQTIKHPKTNFFTNSLYYRNYKNSFQSLEKLIQLDINNINIRYSINNIITFIINQVIETSWEFRKLEANWTKTTTLKQHQKIWLDIAYQQQREEDEAWLNELISEFARWFINAYKKNTGKEDINTKMLTIKTLIEKQKEGLL
jgi:CRISPR-associated protein Csy1